MKKVRSFLGFLGRIEGLPVAIVLIVLIVAFIITAPNVFLKWRIYMSFLQTVRRRSSWAWASLRHHCRRD